MKLLALILLPILFLCVHSAKMIMEDVQSDEAAIVMMLNAERNQRQFVVPLFLSPVLTLTARRVADGLRGQVDRVSWATTGFSFAREIRTNDEFPYVKGASFWHNGVGVTSLGDRIAEWLKDKKIYAEVLSAEFTEIGVGTAGSTSVVLLAARKRECGNGVVESGEYCDDNNTKDGDGCSAKCSIEAFYTCKSFTFHPTSECIQDADLWLRKIYGYGVIGLFGLGIVVATIVYLSSAGVFEPKEPSEVELETQTRVSMKRLKKLEKRRMREEKAKEKQRKIATKLRKKRMREKALKGDE